MKILNTSKPKARKAHKCNFCLLEITKGEVYDSQTNIWDGIIYTWKTHLKCSFLAEELDMYNDSDENGVNDEMFIEYVNNAYDEFQDEEDNTFFGKVSFEHKLNQVYKRWQKKSKIHPNYWGKPNPKHGL